jgi:ascorbate-specific PTS system EIIC-type component UlaA
LGNNSTHGVIITSKGVVLIDSGASYLGAKEIHKTIRKLTNKPIKIVINTGLAGPIPSILSLNTISPVNITLILGIQITIICWMLARLTNQNFII